MILLEKPVLIDTLSSKMEGRRVCLLAVGNPLRADDGVGPAIVRALSKYTPPVFLIDATTTPENVFSEIKAAHPDLMLIVDAVNFQGQPGDVALLTPDQFQASNLYTHRSSLSTFTIALAELAGVSEVLILAIQPARLDFGLPISAQVMATLNTLVELMQIILPKTRNVLDLAESPVQDLTTPGGFQETTNVGGNWETER